ncbi:hypothetical protein QR685DRAFT_96417 [Neurospora intermedia]|uniref:Uncharacterized protein n=1 Tax=Neurospora intermedia TaxID=5142 RepID=A0ABR3D2W4_NEUIN
MFDGLVRLHGVCNLRTESPSLLVRVSRRKLRLFWPFDFERRLFGPGDARVLQASHYMALRIV